MHHCVTAWPHLHVESSGERRGILPGTVVFVEERREREHSETELDAPMNREPPFSLSLSGREMLSDRFNFSTTRME
jgi:hypothetical protein